MQGLVAALAKVMVHEKAVCCTVVDELAAGMVPLQVVHMDPC